MADVQKFNIGVLHRRQFRLRLIKHSLSVIQGPVMSRRRRALRRRRAGIQTPHRQRADTVNPNNILFHQCFLFIAPCLTSQSCEPLRACFSEAEKLNELQISDPLMSTKPSVIFPTASAAGSRSGDGTADSTCAQHRHAAASGPEEPQPPGQQ